MSKITPLTAQQAQARGLRGLALSGNVDAPAIEVVQKFTYQSYFDTALGAEAILAQPPNEQIVPSTLDKQSVAGYAVGLHPASQTPVAVRFLGGEQQGSSATFRLKPGQVLRPFGAAGAPGKFSGFEWGLPFGWLGGGNAMLMVFRTADSYVDWLDRSEVVFHRTRVPIVAPANVPAAPEFNWPTRFPWPHATRGANSLTQRGTPVLSVKPTRCAMTLRLSALVASERMRVYLIGGDEWAEDSAGAIGLTEALGYDVIWSPWASAASANFATQYPVQFVNTEVFRFGANDGGVIFVDITGGLVGSYVDVVRYGVL